MADEDLQIAKREIAASLSLSVFCTNFIGIPFRKVKTISEYFRLKILFFIAAICIMYHVLSELIHIFILLNNNPKIEEVVPLFHTMGYGALSVVKLLVLWYKKDVFAQLIEELATIWPAKTDDEELINIKKKSLSTLSLAHKWYFFANVGGVWLYNLTPIVLYFYNKSQGNDVAFGFVWVCWYPFDKHKPLNHAFAYLLEIIAGQTCVWVTVGSDLLFSTLASHLCLLLRFLQRRLVNLAAQPKPEDELYAELADTIRLHQRLIKYCNDLEEAFTFVNFVNIILSSFAICCVVFVIVLLEPLIVFSSKLFLLSALLQMGVICWYADDIIYANAEVGDAAYNSGWYKANPRFRRALLFLIKRSQKPIAFTAMKFTNISLVTYTSILTRSYSYFTLLYTMYQQV